MTKPAISSKEAAEIAGCSVSTALQMVKRGEMPGAEMRKNERGRWTWYFTPQNVEALVERMNRPGSRRNAQQRIERGGRELYSCAKCEQFLPKHDFFPRERGRFKIRTQCRSCDAKMMKIYVADNEVRVRRQQERRRKQKREWVKKEGARLMREYRTKPHVDGRRVLDALKEAFPGRRLAEISWELGFADGVLRRCNKPITLDKADRILTKAELSHLLHEIAPPPGLPGWSRRHDRCQNTSCGTIEVPHQGAGLCERCHYWEAMTGRERPITGGWSMYHGRCLNCGQTDSPHTGRGICNRCRHKMSREEYEAYEPCYAALR